MIGREKKSKEIQAENFPLSITEGKRDPTRPKNQIPNESILSRHGIGTGAGAGPHPCLPGRTAATLGDCSTTNVLIVPGQR